jgi:hypothetical protein
MPTCPPQRGELDEYMIYSQKKTIEVGDVGNPDTRLVLMHAFPIQAEALSAKTIYPGCHCSCRLIKVILG